MGQSSLVITGISLITPLGDDPILQVKKMYQGISAIQRWARPDWPETYCQVAGDLSARSAAQGIAKIQSELPENCFRKAHLLTSRAPMSTGHSIELAVRAWLDAGLFRSKNWEALAEEACVVVGGTNNHTQYTYEQMQILREEPDYIDPMAALYFLDTDHASSVSEALGIKGGAYVVGAACAASSTALRSAIDEIRYHGATRAVVVGPVYDPSFLEVHSLGMMGALCMGQFRDQPQKASRPFDSQREGFVPSQGGAAIVIETAESAIAREAKIYAEILGVEISSDANHLPHPSQSGQALALKKLLRSTGIAREQISYVNAHATSTPQGDLTEINALIEVFGEHAKNLRINAPKSILGHTCWSSGLVETVTALIEMQDQFLYPSINIDQLDSRIELNIQRRAEPFAFDLMLKNSFGFGGLNCVSLLRKWNGR